MTERLANLARGLLASGINNTSDPVTLTLDDASSFPSAGDFRLIVTDGISSELMLGTARTGDDITATRAQEGTIKHAFSSSATVALVLTADSLQDLIDIHPADPTGAHAASAIAFTPSGSVSSLNVQDAIAEAAQEGGTTGMSFVDGGNASQTWDGGNASSTYPASNPKLDGGAA
jgi:hypothetical protein